MLDFGFSLFFLVLAITAFRKLPLAYAVYSLVILLVPLSYPGVFSQDSSLVINFPLYSMPRFVLEAFPVFILLAIWGSKKRWVNWSILISFVILLLFLTTRYVVGEFVA
ncbi:MAG: hypothetical protein ACYCW5_05760 [Thermoleophilia bacterium]